MKELTSSFFSPLPLLTGMVILSVCVLVTVPVCALAQTNVTPPAPVNSDSSSVASRIQDYAVDTYRVHDIEDTSSLTKGEWAFQWIYSPMTFREEVLPLYAYELCPQPSGEGDCEQPTVVCTSDVDTPRELDFFSALLLGRGTWAPSEYELGYAGLVRKNPDPSESDTALTGLFLGPSDRPASDESLTLGSVCGVIGNVIALERHGDNGTIDYRNWLLVTKNPIPDFDPYGRLWTNLSEDVINTSQPQEAAQSSAGE